MEYILLNNGVKMPIIGFGTYFINIADTTDSVYYALTNGYTHLDTAKWYNNEFEVYKAIKKSNIPREDLFITCKIESKGYTEAIKDIEDTLDKLKTNYLDLIIIHWPNEQSLDTYKALEKMYNEKKTRAIGLSNFNESLCEYIIENSQILPQINQIETHIYFQQQKMHKYLNKKNIVHESWSPFAEGTLNVFNNKEIIKIAKKHNKTPAQIMLKYLITNNIIVIPKSKDINHIKENIDIFDFKLDKEDIIIIKSLDKRKQLSNWPISMSCETKY